MTRLLLPVATFAALLAGCSPEPTNKNVPATTPRGGVSAALHNVHQPCEGIWSGSEPQGADAFRELRRMGIQTIVSVDGASPDLANAEKFGMRYVHLPHGYDGIPPNTAAALAGLKAEDTGPLYVHCHHGKHRGPAAACIVAMGRKKLDPKSAKEFLEFVGTGKGYTGLWRDVAGFPSLPSNTVPAPLLASAPVSALVESMTQLDRAFTSLLESKQPDGAQILLVFEGFTESLRHLPEDAPNELRQMMEASLKEAASLRDEPIAAPDILPILKRQCIDCHKKFRDA